MSWLEEQVIERLRVHGPTFARDALVVALCFVAAEYLRFFPHELPASALRPLLFSLPAIAAVYVLFIYLFGVHRRLWQYAGIGDIRSLVDAVIVATLVVGVVDFALFSADFSSEKGRPVPFAAVIVGGMFSLFGLAFVRLWPRLLRTRRSATDEWARVLIVGAGQGGNLVAADLLGNLDWRQHPVGFLDDDPSKRRRRIHDLPVLGTIDSLPEIVAAHGIDVIGVAIPSASTKELDRILELAQQTPARIQVLPSHGEMMTRHGPLRLRDIKLGDLLNRVPATESTETAMIDTIITDRVVLVTGAAGSIGSELCRQVMQHAPSMLIAVDNNETGLFHLERDLQELSEPSVFKIVLGDVTDSGKMAGVFRRHQPDVVFHAAAYKHVPILEAHPDEAVNVNVRGTLTICNLAASNGCDRFVFVSTDKAVHPVNALGFSKRIGELLTRAHHGKGPIYCSVRFGNVVGSRGSAIPEFIRQIEAGGPVLVTHPDVERYFMTIPEAVTLVIQAASLAEGGELFMLDMGEPVRIVDLAKRIIRLRGLRVGTDIEIMYTGLRPGEKLTEDLVFHGERSRPTQNPAIVCVEDDDQPALEELEAGVHILTSLAEAGESGALRAALAGLATRQGTPVTGRLGIVK